MLISVSGSADGVASSILGGSGRSGFDGSINVASSFSTETISDSATIKKDNSSAGTGGVSGDSLFSTSSATSGNSVFVSIVSVNRSVGEGEYIAASVGSTDSGNVG